MQAKRLELGIFEFEQLHVLVIVSLRARKHGVTTDKFPRFSFDEMAEPRFERAALGGQISTPGTIGHLEVHRVHREGAIKSEDVSYYEAANNESFDQLQCRQVSYYQVYAIRV